MVVIKCGSTVRPSTQVKKGKGLNALLLKLSDDDDMLAEVYPVQCTTQNKTRKGERCGTREICTAARKTTRQVARTSTMGVLTERGGINEMHALLCRVR